MSDLADITPNQRLAITKAWTRGDCWCDRGHGICPSCDASPPTCTHPTCHTQYRQRTRRPA